MLRVERSAGIFKQNGRLIEACVAVDMLCEPCLDIGEVGTGKSLAKVAEVLFHGGEHLRAVSATERVGGEIAEAAARPVGILQTALRIVRNVNAEIFLV